MRPAIRGIVFDKDGTLFDFHATWRGVISEALAGLAPHDAGLRHRLGAAVGFDGTTGVFTPGSLIVAGSTGEVAAAWAALMPGAVAAEIEAAANALATGVGPGDLVPAAPDLAALMDGFRALGCALGVATHDSEAAARRQLTLVGALDRFDFVAGYDSGHGLKPGPGMIRAFCAATGRRPEETAMIGDSLHDLEAGRAAGAGFVVGVLTGPAARSDLERHADLVLNSIAELPEALFSA
jgi:phosphoglycolate phosphatase